MGWDFANIFLYGFVEASRLFFSKLLELGEVISATKLLFVSLVSRGNKTADLESLFWGSIFCIPIIAMHGYYINLQTYV
jgi:hypothetical protein